MRSIRLKEIRPNYEDRLSPTDSYRAQSNSTLQAGPFRRRGTTDGFLDTTQDRPDASKRLVFLGGSFVESMFINERLRFPAIVERDLPDEWCVRNGGYSGMTTLHLLGLLSMKIPPLLTPGSKVVIFIGMSDAFALRQPGRYWDPHPFVTPIEPAPESTPAPPSLPDALRGVVRATLATADALGMDFGVVSSPYRAAGMIDVDPDSPEGTRRLIQAVAREEAARLSRPFFDSQPHMAAGDFYDALHLNETGQRRYAEALGGWLRTDLGL